MSDIFAKAPKWVEKHTIFLTVAGSNAYGTNTPESDIDYRGVCTVPKEYLLGFRNSFEQYECKDPDATIFSLRKWAHLASQANPNILELLFVDLNSIIKADQAWLSLRDIRQQFLSKKIVQTFSGYAKSQLHKIQTHRGYLLHPIKVPPTRKEFGLPDKPLIPKLHAADAAVQKLLDGMAGEWAIDKSDQLKLYDKAATALGFDSNFVELLYKEKQYSARMCEYESYKKWEKERNPVRKALEAKYGFDSKSMMHLVRLMRMCLECLENCTLYVKRPDAEELLSIRNGAWSYEEVMQWSESMKAKIKTALLVTKLPEAPNLDLIESKIIEISNSAIL